MSIHRTLVPVGEVPFEDDVIEVRLDAAMIVDDADLSVAARSVYGVDLRIRDIDGKIRGARVGCDALALARLIDILSSARAQMIELDSSQPRSAADDVPSIADTCCGKCVGSCYVDQVTGA